MDAAMVEECKSRITRDIDVLKGEKEKLDKLKHEMADWMGYGGKQDWVTPAYIKRVCERIAGEIGVLIKEGAPPDPLPTMALAQCNVCTRMLYTREEINKCPICMTSGLP